MGCGRNCAPPNACDALSAASPKKSPPPLDCDIDSITTAAKMPATKPEEKGESSTSAAKKALATTNGTANYELPWCVFDSSLGLTDFERVLLTDGEQGRKVPARLPRRRGRQHRDDRAAQDHRQGGQHAARHH